MSKKYHDVRHLCIKTDIMPKYWSREAWRLLMFTNWAILLWLTVLSRENRLDRYWELLVDVLERSAMHLLSLDISKYACFMLHSICLDGDGYN